MDINLVKIAAKVSPTTKRIQRALRQASRKPDICDENIHQISRTISSVGHHSQKKQDERQVCCEYAVMRAAIQQQNKR